MELTHIPPEAVRLINALAAQPEASLPEALLEAFRTLCANARRWLEFNCGYTRDDDEKGRLEHIGLLWDDVEAALECETGREILPALVPPLYQVIHRMGQINRERARGTYSRHPALNDFIAAGSARLEGRAETRALVDRLVVVKAWADNLSQIYHGVEERLLPEVRAELERAFAALDKALADAAQATEQDDVDLLKGSLADLTKLEPLVQSFLDWDQADQERLAGRHARFNIPMLGPQLELALESARKVPRGAWVPAVRTVKGLQMPQVHALWEQRRASVLMPSTIREECLAEVDQALQSLDEAVDNLLRPRFTEQQSLAGFERALTALSDAFTRLESRAFPYEHLAGTDAETWWEVLQGILAESVPDEALIEMVRENPPPAAWGPVMEKIKAYLGSRDPLLLCDAAEALIEQVKVPDTGAVEEWTCVFCGHSNSSGEGECGKCHQRTQGELQVEGWQA